MNLNWIETLKKYDKTYIICPQMSGNGGCMGFDILFEGRLKKTLTMTPMNLGYEDWEIQEFDYIFKIGLTKDLDNTVYRWNKYDYYWELEK